MNSAIKFPQAYILAATININEQQIKEIAENLDCGLSCFFNKQTGEIKTILNFDRWIGGDEELWDDELKEIDENRGDYFEFEKERKMNKSTSPSVTTNC